MEIVCPECYNENAFFNGVCYECPDCDHEWSDDSCPNDNEEDDEDSDAL